MGIFPTRPAPDWYTQTEILWDEGKFEEAIHIARRAYEYFFHTGDGRETARARYRLGHMLAQLGIRNRPEAIRVLTLVSIANPYDEHTRAVLDECLRKNGQS